ncbi:MAG TPA: Tex-like N-terminal domain-containing protein, partial [Planctomycetota bacterium]|nr:Tex-like N-terminal domain-containing protein [Planctomycetota bacterium]
MTSIRIVEHLAREYRVDAQHVRALLEMVDAGLQAPFIGRVRRAATGELSEGQVRHLVRARSELEELDRRRGTILRMLGADVSPEDGGASGEAGEVASRATPKAPESVIEAVRACMDRFELEDLFLPHRRPEPEVQLALDRGLARLADDLVAPLSPERRAQLAAEGHDDVHDDNEPEPESERAAPAESAPAVQSAPEASGPEASGEDAEAVEQDQAAHAEAEAAHTAAEAGESAAQGEGDGEGEEDHAAEADAERAAAEARSGREEELLHGQLDLTPALARLATPYVNPDRGVHTETEALSGAVRILSDRLGRDARLRGVLRRMLRKQGVLSVRALADESRLGRHKGLLKLRQPLRQVQGHRLLGLRQAQKERVLQMQITLERKLALPKVRAALGRHTDPEFAGVLDAIALRSLEYRLMPLLEADVRLELKERADEEALRFLSQHLRQVLLSSGAGEIAVGGLDVNAKGDWTLVLVEAGGKVAGEPLRVETSEKDAAALGAELKAALIDASGPEPVRRVRGLAVGHGKQSRAAVPALRAALAAAELQMPVFIVNDSGLASYASSELARRELPELSVPQRMAASLARRLQDPLAEIVKVDPRHLGLGSEQGLVSKANLRRVLDETVESCAALVGCDVNIAGETLLSRLPGLDAKAAARLLARRAERPFESREELRAEGLLDESAWVNAAAFLRVRGPNPLDATGLHPEQYELAARLVEAGGGTLEESVGRPGVTKGLRRTDFGVDEHTWRDLMRELAWPASDPRRRVQPVLLLDPATDRATLTKDRVVEGIITNVTSFGAFVDLGLDHDGMVHVSEISDRYVRDARELISVGQTVRARILDGSSQRVALSLKRVPPPPREARPPRDERPRKGGRGRGPERERESRTAVPVRAAASRRDGLVTGSGGKGRGGPGRGGPGRGGDRGRRRDGDERVSA